MILINGESTEQIKATDRGLHYGDGLFETIEVIDAQPIFLSEHLARLKLGCQRLKIPYPDETLLLDEIKQVSLATPHGIVKIMLTRGSGGRGYRQPDTIQSTRFVALYLFPEYPPSYQSVGIKVRFCDYRLGLNPLLAGLKHNNRLDQVLARSEWQDEYQEGLMLNLNEEVIEGTMSNLFVLKGGQLYTPRIEMSGVKGVVRSVIMKLAQQQGIVVEESRLSREFVCAADALFLSNSVIGIWPINSLDNKTYAVGEITQKLMRSLEAAKVL